MLGVEREQAVLQSQRLDQFRRGRDLVALFRDHHMREHDLIGMTQRRHHMRGLAVVEGVEAAAQRLAVDGDGGQPLRGRRRRQANGMASKRGLQRLCVDALKMSRSPV